MQVWAVVASGQSLKDQEIQTLRLARAAGAISGIIAVSNVGIDKLPDADALVSHDSGWWISHPEALKFAGKKYSARAYRSTIGFDSTKHGHARGVNSGLMGMYIAHRIYKADRVLLLGFDMHGTHYFGKHTRVYNGKTLVNTDAKKFAMHKEQFKQFKGCEVFNCNLDSELLIFPKVKLCDILNVQTAEQPAHGI